MLESWGRSHHQCLVIDLASFSNISFQRTYETCAWTPNNVFLSMIVVESLSCKLEWGLAQVFAISIPLTIVAVESEVYECQTKYAKAIFVGFFKHHDSRSARNGCHGTAGLRYLGLGT